MSTYKIELTDELSRRLAALAEQNGLTPEELISSGVEQWLERSTRDFGEAASYILEKNAELYRRLA